MEQIFKDDPLGESNAKCDLEDMFDSADENGCFDASKYNNGSLYYAVTNGYVDAVSFHTLQVTEKGWAFLAEYKKEMQELENLALHAVD